MYVIISNWSKKKNKKRMSYHYYLLSSSLTFIICQWNQMKLTVEAIWGRTKTHDKNPSPNSQIYSRLKFRLKFSEVPTSVVDKMDRLAQLPDQIHLHPDTLPCPRNLIQWFGAEETPAITPPPWDVLGWKERNIHDWWSPADDPFRPT